MAYCRNNDQATFNGIPLRLPSVPVQVEMAAWSAAGTLDCWVKERRPRLQWFGRVRGADGKQRWIKAVDLRPVSGHG